MRIQKMLVAVLGAAMVAAAWADDPTVVLSRVQQRYPWNGLVDIDYTVANVPNPEDYYVKFTVSNHTAKTSFVLDNFQDDRTLAVASNGTYRVTWRSGALPVEKFLSKNVTVRADLIFDPGCNGARTPYRMHKYLIIDLTEGPNAASYPIEVEYFKDQAAANTKFNTIEYKTNKLVLRRILRGTFIMGAPVGETGRQGTTWMYSETQHAVTLTQDYYLGIFEVTQTQWMKVMNTNPSYFKSNADMASCPVEMVSYRMIRGATKGIALPITGEVDEGTFIKVLRDKTGLSALDLPTEAQWEYATRAGTTDSTYFGNNVSAAVLNANAWYKGNAGAKTHGAGQFSPNNWGLYDTLGNTWEWCLDRVKKIPSADIGSAAVTDPLAGRQIAQADISATTQAILRGGSITHELTVIRCACRTANEDVTSTLNEAGFRLSVVLP